MKTLRDKIFVLEFLHTQMIFNSRFWFGKFWCYILVFGLCACNHEIDLNQEDMHLFRLASPDSTGVYFTNSLVETPLFNILTYQYFYNGGGVAIGDVNQDGLEDLFFTSNQSQNRLYLNQGNLKFRDVSLATGTVGKENAWTTGAVMVDINADGLMDIYVCYSGSSDHESRRNQLFVNQGNDAQGIPFFKEQAASFGLDDSAYSTAAYFFDMDGDLDLDLLLLNHNPVLFNQLSAPAFKSLLNSSEPESMSKLYENQNGLFVDITAESGLSTSGLSYALGAGVVDLDGDGLPDIYLGNDYSAPDYVYKNLGKGKFREELSQSVSHTSLYTMGIDFGDINGDGLQDLVTLDMLPEDSKRQKLLFSPENYEHHNLFLDVGLHSQHMRNMLQLNQGSGKFVEIGEFSGVAKTDWSWTPLLADFDLDGNLDLIVTNGFLKDFTNLDFINYRENFFKSEKPSQLAISELIARMPATPLSNYAYRNQGDLSFENVSKLWGLDLPGNSNGAAYADLDGDGDLDLVINNLNQPAWIFENTQQQRQPTTWVKVKFNGPYTNPKGIGTRITFFAEGKAITRESMPYRGYQGNVSFEIHAGLGGRSLDSLEVLWSDGKVQRISEVSENQLIELDYRHASFLSKPESLSPKLFSRIGQIAKIDHRVIAEDFKIQPQLLYGLNHELDLLTVGDLIGDESEDVLWYDHRLRQIQIFEAKSTSPSKENFTVDQRGSLQDMAILDWDMDGKNDVLLAFSGKSDSGFDFLYLLKNQNNGRFELEDLSAIVDVPIQTLVKGDFDGDGDLDLFVGGGYVYGRWPLSAPSYILINRGRGIWEKVASDALQESRRIQAAASWDLDGDGAQELILASEFDPIRILGWSGTEIIDRTLDFFETSHTGLWSSVRIGDFNRDGVMELLVGNWGTNSRLKASPEKPIKIYVDDFDQNGSIDPLMTQFFPDGEYPVFSRDELVAQLYRKRSDFDTHEVFSSASIEQILSQNELGSAVIQKVETLETAYFEFRQGKFIPKDFPAQVQFAPVYAIESFELDGKLYLAIGGNQFQSRLKIGKLDANILQLFRWENQMWIPISPVESGVFLPEEIRSLVWINQRLWSAGSRRSIYQPNVP